MIDKSGWNLIINENFDNTTIQSVGNRWNFTPNGLWNQGDIFQYTLFKPSNLNIRDGKLYMSQNNFYNNPLIINGDTAYSDGAWISYKLPQDCSNESNAMGFQRGIFEIRCRLPKTINTSWVNPSFWLMGSGGEIDVFEVPGDQIGTNEIMCSTHYDDKGTHSCINYYQKKTQRNISEDFHTFTIAWTPTELTWFFDGKEIETRTNLSNYLKNQNACTWGRMALITYLNKPFPGSTTPLNTDSFEIDYIRVYKPKTENTQWSYRKNSGLSQDKNFAILNPFKANVKKSRIIATNTNIYYIGISDNKLYNYYKVGNSWQWAVCNNVNDVAEDLTLYQNRIYYRSTSNSLKYFEWNGSSWINFSTPVTGNCAGFINVDMYGKVFYKGVDNNLYLWSTGWTTPTKISNDGSVRGGLSVDKCGCIAFWRDQSNNLRQAYWNNQWYLLGVVVSNNKVTDHIVYDNNYNVYFAGNDKFVYKYKANYSSPSNNITPLSTSMDDKNCLGELLLSPDKQILYYKGDDNRLWYYFNDISVDNTDGIWYASPSNWNNTLVDGPIAVNDNNIYFRSNFSNSIAEIIFSNGIIRYTECDSIRTPKPMYKNDNDFTLINDTSNLNSEKSIDVFPNPFGDFIEVGNISPENLFINVKLVDVLGKVVVNDKLEVNQNLGIATFPIDEVISKGTYTLLIADINNIFLTSKVILKK
jgi:beta-glucanase (GH16 family)